MQDPTLVNRKNKPDGHKERQGKNGAVKRGKSKPASTTVPDKKETTDGHTIKQSKRSCISLRSESDKVLNANFWGRVERPIANFFQGKGMSLYGNYGLGLAIGDLMAEPDKYGSGAVLKLAAEVGLSDKTLYEFKAVATAFNYDDLELAVKPDDDGHLTVYWSHLVSLARVKKATARNKLLHNTRNHRWTVEKLSEEIAKVLGKARPVLQVESNERDDPSMRLDAAAAPFVSQLHHYLELGEDKFKVTADERKALSKQVKEIAALCTKFLSLLKSSQD